MLFGLGKVETTDVMMKRWFRFGSPNELNQSIFMSTFHWEKYLPIFAVELNAIHYYVHTPLWHTELVWHVHVLQYGVTTEDKIKKDLLRGSEYWLDGMPKFLIHSRPLNFVLKTNASRLTTLLRSACQGPLLLLVKIWKSIILGVLC